MATMQRNFYSLRFKKIIKGKKLKWLKCRQGVASNKNVNSRTQKEISTTTIKGAREWEPAVQLGRETGRSRV